MIHLKRLMATAGMFIGLMMTAHTAFACSMLPIWFLNPTTALDSKLPLVRPDFIADSGTGGGGGSCATPSWPMALASLSDADIAQYLGADEAGGTGGAAGTLAPAWDATKVYVAGDMASYGNENYKARWWTQGETPSPTSSVWEEQPDAYGNPPAWQSTVGYPQSSQVSYQGNIYSAKWWSQNEVPGTAGTAWVLIGPMTQPVIKRPAMFQASVNYSGSSGFTGTWTTGNFSSTDYPLADTWQVRVNGIVVQQSAPQTLVADCLPTATLCTAAYVQKGSFSFSMEALDQFSLWLCAKNVCRPSPRVTILLNTIDKPAMLPN